MGPPCPEPSCKGKLLTNWSWLLSCLPALGLTRCPPPHPSQWALLLPDGGDPGDRADPAGLPGRPDPAHCHAGVHPGLQRREARVLCVHRPALQLPGLWLRTRPHGPGPRVCICPRGGGQCSNISGRGAGGAGTGSRLGASGHRSPWCSGSPSASSHGSVHGEEAKEPCRLNPAPPPHAHTLLHPSEGWEVTSHLEPARRGPSRATCNGSCVCSTETRPSPFG